MAAITPVTKSLPTQDANKLKILPFVIEMPSSSIYLPPPGHLQCKAVAKETHDTVLTESEYYIPVKLITAAPAPVAEQPASDPTPQPQMQMIPQQMKVSFEASNLE